MALMRAGIATGLRSALIAALALASALAAGADLPAGALDYHVAKTVLLGAPDRWDYVVFDPSSNRVFVAHGDRVSVVDGTSGAIVGDVTGFPGGTHGVAIAPGAGRGYSDDGRAGEAGAFDLKSLKAEGHVKAGEGSDAMAYDPVSRHVFVVNGSGSLTVIDPATNTAAATIAVGGGLEYAVAGGNGKLYVNGAERREVVRVDTHSNQVDARWPVTECQSPHGLAIDRAAHRLFVSCVNQLLIVVDADSGATVARVPIGRGTDAAAFDPRRKLVFSSNGLDGTISVIEEVDANTFRARGNITTVPTARTMDVDPRTGRLFLAEAEIDTKALAAAAAGAPPAAVTPGPGLPRRRPPLLPGSFKLVFLDPAH
jgi:YVTN family beta-propeller protein